MRRATAVLALAVAFAILSGSLWTAAAAGSTGHDLPRRGMAAYEWHHAGDLSTAEARRRLKFLRANGFATVYLEIGDYLEAADEPSGTPGRRDRLKRIRREIQRYVALATRYGIAVHAVGGAPNWIGELGYLGRLLVELVGSYNREVGFDERLRGVQLDIEPYVDNPLFDTDPQAVIADYLDTVGGIVRTYRRVLGRSANRGLQLGFAVPFWFDAEGGAPGPVYFEGTGGPGSVKPAVHHIIDLLKDLPGGYLVVMSYRNFTDTDNGSIALAANEFRYAREVGARSGLVVGQQYAAVTPDYITFDGQQRSEFRVAAAAITEAFRRYPQFRGLSVDDLDSYMAARP